MAEISPVRDPNYEGFNYQGLLDRAVEPLNRLGAGQLAIAQQQGQRMFEMRRQQAEAQSGQARDLARLNEEDRIREAFRQRIRNEGAATTFAKADYKPDPNLSLEQNVAAASKVEEDKVFEGFKPLANTVKKSQQDHLRMLDRYGASAPIPQRLVNLKVLEDPAMVSLLTGSHGPQIREALQSGKTPDEILKSQTWYWGAGNNRNAILTALDKAKTDLQTQQQQVAALRAGAEGQFTLSKYNQNNELLNGMISTASPTLRARMATYLGQGDEPAATPTLDANGLLPPADLNNAGSIGTLPPPAVQDVTVPPGTTAALNPNFYTHKAAHEGALADVASNQKELEALQNKADNLGRMLVPPPGQTVPGRIDFGGGGMPTIPYMGVTSPNPATGGFTPFTTQEAGDIATQRLDALGKIEKLKKQISQASTDANLHYQSMRSFDPTAPAPLDAAPDEQMPSFTPIPAPNDPSIPPPATPRSFMPATTPGIMAPTQPQDQPTAMSGGQDNFKVMSAQNKIYQIIGTSEPGALAKIKSYVQGTLGWQPQQVHAVVTAALNGDQNAIAQMRKITADATGSGGGGQYGQFALSATPPDASLPPMPDGQSFGI